MAIYHLRLGPNHSYLSELHFCIPRWGTFTSHAGRGQAECGDKDGLQDPHSKPGFPPFPRSLLSDFRFRSRFTNNLSSSGHPLCPTWDEATAGLPYQAPQTGRDSPPGGATQTLQWEWRPGAVPASSPSLWLPRVSTSFLGIPRLPGPHCFLLTLKSVLLM